MQIMKQKYNKLENLTINDVTSKEIFRIILKIAMFLFHIINNSPAGKHNVTYNNLNVQYNRLS